MFTLFLVPILLGALLSLVGAISALRAWFRLNRVRSTFQRRVTDEVSHLSARANELERGVDALNRRASTLPVQIDRLQRNIAILQTLTASLAVTLRQASRVLTFSGLKTLSASSLGDALQPLFDRFDRP